MITAMAIELSGMRVRADEWSETCSTAIDSVSGYVVVVISVLESRALLVASAYLAHVGGPTARVASAQQSRRCDSVSPADHRADGGPDTRARACSITPWNWSRRPALPCMRRTAELSRDHRAPGGCSGSRRQGGRGRRARRAAGHKRSTPCLLGWRGRRRQSATRPASVRARRSTGRGSRARGWRGTGGRCSRWRPAASGRAGRPAGDQLHVQRGLAAVAGDLEHVVLGRVDRAAADLLGPVAEPLNVGGQLGAGGDQPRERHPLPVGTLGEPRDRQLEVLGGPHVGEQCHMRSISGTF
jgi:hypothetical protein